MEKLPNRKASRSRVLLVNHNEHAAPLPFWEESELIAKAYARERSVSHKSLKEEVLDV